MERYLLILAAAAVFSSCGNTASYISILEGNNHYQLGKYNQAVISYFRAGAAKIYPEFISYDVGNVYHALGETEAAFQEWEKALQIKGSESFELLYRSHFNKGVAYFEQGKYQASFKEFREALLIKPTSTEAKIDLEYCIQKIQRGIGPQSQSQESAGAQGNKGNSRTAVPGASSNTQRILDYIKRKEENQWQSQQILNSEKAENDY